jgi:DNA-directed RNA polymerase subunit RPC12/RpoP
MTTNVDTQPHKRPQYVFATMVRCPACGSPRLRAYRTSRHGDDSVTRYTRCQACGEKFFLILE